MFLYKNAVLGNLKVTFIALVCNLFAKSIYKRLIWQRKEK